ncbi:MAG: DUF111 family protein, partial [Bacillota bacterium]|nr:DUF111 family protein [Bacillota bacterium]
VAAALYAVSFILCIKALNCKAVYNSPLELNLASDIRLLDILKGTEVKLVRDSACEVDCCAAAFIAAIGQSKDALEGRVLEVSKGEEKGSEINVILFECEDKYEKDIQYIVECNIDDMNSEGYDYIFNKLLSAGALDVYITPIIMKKGRPAVKLSVLTSSERLNEVKEHIFRETSTFGVRSYQVEKSMLERSFGKIDVCGETVRIKYGYFNGKTIKCKPEYEDCRRIAQKEGLGINRVYTEALRNMPPII